MKKLGIMIAVASLAIATPVFACPHDEGSPKTAEKAKDEKGQDKDKAKEAPPKKDTETAKAKEQPKKPAKEEPAKKPEKVSQK